MNKTVLGEVMTITLTEACAKAEQQAPSSWESNKTKLAMIGSLAPPRISLADYVCWLLSFVSTSQEHYVMALILLARLEHRQGIAVTNNNVVYLLVGALVVSMRVQLKSFALEQISHQLGFPSDVVLVFEEEVRSALNYETNVSLEQLDWCCNTLHHSNRRNILWCELGDEEKHENDK
eukprot:c10055_g1_i1.p1 GENE.c10055_g1_i1~~c10055_g1_i1.p1  ORF type:complete len:192 (+),score=41.43 c10055_g1_i1:44-577(+)